jgi:lipoate-protein ligase B
MSKMPILVKNLGRSDYRETWRAMQDFTNARDQDTADELWITEHAPVFTQGLNGRAEHLLAPGDIPVVQIDRGGQVTYHGPGQLVLYCLLDITRLGLGVKGLVALIGAWIAYSKRMLLSWPEPQRRYGIGTVYPDQSLRLSGPRGNSVARFWR